MYIVLEIQKNIDGQIATLTNSYETLDLAYQKYYLVLSAAAVSQLPRHGVILISDEIQVLNFDSFDHE